MNVSVKGRRVEVSDSLRAYAEKRARSSVDVCVPTIDVLHVCFADENGPRGGVDKRCLIEVKLRGIGALFARAQDADAYTAVDRAAARMRAVLRRVLGRRRASSRRPAIAGRERPSAI